MKKITTGTTAENSAPTVENKNDATGAVIELSNVSVDKTTGELSESQEQPARTLPPIEMRLKKLSELLEMQEKREVLVKHLENLNRFYISPSGQGCNLKLTDSKGNSFGISHPAIIGEMVNMATGKLQDELTKLESEFIFEV